MRIIAYLEVPAEPGEAPIDVRDRTAINLAYSGFHPAVIEVVTETAVITKVAEDKPKPQATRRVYQSPIYPGTDEFYEFYRATP